LLQVILQAAWSLLSILDRMQTMAGQLTASERRLVREVVSKPRDVALGTAAALAKRSGVHEATASRLARKLGFAGYSGFREAIRDELFVRTDPAVRVRNTLQTSPGGDLLAELVTREIEALAALPSFVSFDRLREVAEVVAGARKVYIFATGNAEALAVMMSRRLRRLALEAEVLRGNGRDVAEQIIGLRRDDVLLVFAFRRQPWLYSSLLERGRALGARSVVIAGSIGPALVPAADYVLSAPRSGEPNTFQTLSVPMALCNALVLAIMQSDEQDALRRLEALGELIEDLERR
jgi:DNA-binding MurR/RpiR family transcriptional regulator